MANIIGDAGDDLTTGTTGDDVINLMTGGSDTAEGGQGNDRLISDGNDYLYGGAGIDTADLRLSGSSVNYTIDLTAELLGGVDYDIGDGHTFLSSIERLFFYGGSGNDLIKGGIYDDRIDGGTGADSLYGGAGNDQLFGHNGNKILDGGAGADVITIDGYVDSIEGGSNTGGNQYDFSAIDKLYITGTAGFDSKGHVGDIHGIEQIYVTAGLTVSFSKDGNPQDITHYQASTNSIGTDTYGHQVYTVDKLVDGTYLGVNISGSGFGDTITGGSGNDVLVGDKGNDTLYGGAGNDTISGGVGHEKLFGGAGDDRFIVNSGPDQQPDFTVDGGSGIDVVNLNNQLNPTGLLVDFHTGSTTVAGTTFVSIEKLEYNGGAGNDTIIGGAYDDKLTGGGGNDSFTGGGGNDLLFGKAGDDDVANYSGNKADYTVTKVNATQYTVTDNTSGFSEGTDTLFNIKHLHFADGDVLLA